MTNDLLLLYGFHLHVFVSIISITGLCMLYYWATRNLPPNVLKKWAIILLVVGFIGVLITVPLCLFGQALMTTMHQPV